MFLFMASTASAAMSLVIMFLTPGISLAYRMERNPDAAKASKTWIPSYRKETNSISNSKCLVQSQYSFAGLDIPHCILLVLLVPLVY